MSTAGRESEFTVSAIQETSMKYEHATAVVNSERVCLAGDVRNDMFLLIAAAGVCAEDVIEWF